MPLTQPPFHRSAALRALGRHALAWAGLLLAYAAGLWVTDALSLPLPGILGGMALLLALLALWPAGIAVLEPAVRPLLAVMVLLFIPAGAKLVSLAPRMAQAWLPILAVVLLSTLLALAVTAWTVRSLARWLGPGAGR